MKFIENLKKKNRHNLFFLLIFIVVIVLPIIVIATGSQLAGYKINRNTSQYKVMGLSNIRTGIDIVCVTNSDASRDFFVPTRTLNEWNQFQANKPTALTVHTSCCGDLVCNGTETCVTCPGDCGSCPPACYSASDCGSASWSGPWSCSGQTVRGYWNTYSCNSGNCVLNSTLSNYVLCGGGEDSRCINGYNTCYAYCSDWVDNDNDGYMDGKDTDCLGCANYECIWSGQASCSESTNCFLNGGSCGTGRVWVSGTCQCTNGNTYYASSNSCGGPCFYNNTAGAYVTVNSSYNCSTGAGVNNPIACPKGSYNPVGGGNSCRVCPAGTYSGTGANSCSQCQAGHYCPRGIQLPCPSGQTSNAGAASCFSTSTYY